MTTIHFKADNFRVYNKSHDEVRSKTNLINLFKSDLINNGISKSIADALEIDVNIDNKFPRKIHFDIKINDDEYYYLDSLSYIDLSTLYTNEAYVVAGKVADEFAKDLQECIDDYIEQIGTDTSNLPTNISFLEAYEFIFNNTEIKYKWTTNHSVEFDTSSVKFAIRNSEWDSSAYLIFDKINKEFLYYDDIHSHKFNPFKIDIDILNNDKWSIIEYKSG